MARSVNHDPYHVFRFGVRFDGQLPMGFCDVEIAPKREHAGSGSVTMTAALMPLIMDFLGQKKRGSLDVLAYHITDEFGVDGKPSLTFRMHGVQPSRARPKPIKWDASADGVLLAQMTLDYERLEMIQDGIPMSQPRPRARIQPTVVM
jgi:hypothetical protein